MKIYTQKLRFLSIIFLASLKFYSQISIESDNVTYGQNFNTLADATFSPWANNVTLPGWYAQSAATHEINSYGQGNVSLGDGGLQAFGLTADKALGFIASESFTGTEGSGAGYIGFRLINNTGFAITNLSVTYTGGQWSRNSDEQQQITLQIRIGHDLTDLVSGIWTECPLRTFNSLQSGTFSALDGNAASNRQVVTTNNRIPLTLAPGEEAMLRWTDRNDPADDHAMAIDDVYVYAERSYTNAHWSLTTDTATDISPVSAVLNATAFADAADFGLNNLKLQYGLTTAYSNVIIPTPNETSGTAPYAISQTITGLAVNTQYHFRVVGNGTSPPAPPPAPPGLSPLEAGDRSFFTAANIPGAPVFNDITSSGATLSFNIGTINGNPEVTEYAIQDDASGLYIQADGTLGSDPAWLTSADIYSDNELAELIGKNIYFFGDSITSGANTGGGMAYPIQVASALGMTRVDPSTYAVPGTTMMKQTPIDPLAPHNMEYWATAPNTPVFNSTADGLIFISYLTNDVGINLANYTLENFGTAIDNVISGVLAAGWPKLRIKFNARYYINDTGLNYSELGIGITTPATLTRYNQFADLLKTKLDAAGIQYFDHWDILAAVPSPDSHLDAPQRHPDSFDHTIITNNILNTISITDDLPANVIFVTGLSPGTVYSFHVKARNGDLMETVFGDAANFITNAINCDVPPTLTIQQPTCDNNEGTITITAPSGDNFAYSIDGGTTYQASAAFTGLQAGSYSVSYQDLSLSCMSSPVNADLIYPAADITLVSEPGTFHQTICLGSPISAISYTIGSQATDATVTGLPIGVTGSYSDGILTISGTPGSAGDYTYSLSTNACSATAGTIAVVDDVATLELVSDSGLAEQHICEGNAIAPIEFLVGGSALGAESTIDFPGMSTQYEPGSGIFTISSSSLPAGAYSYTITTVGGCGSDSFSGTIIVELNPGPLNLMCEAASGMVTFDWESVPGTTAYAYTYTVDGQAPVSGTITTPTNLNITGLGNGQGVTCTVYAIGPFCRLIETADCSAMLAMSQFVADDIHGYPNPVKDVYHFDALRQGAKITVFNMLGQDVLRPVMRAGGSVDLSGLGQGMYVLRIARDGIDAYVRIVKE